MAENLSTLCPIHTRSLSGIACWTATPEEFNTSLLIFLAKGFQADDVVQVTRVPEQTRPLNLANTDQKLIAKLLERPLAAVAQRTVVMHQHGFVKGRRIPDAILAVELP